jgi:hypothetical protein
LPEETYSSSLTLTVADNVVLKAVLSGGKYIITLTNNNNYPVDVNVYMSVDDNCSHSFSDETLMPSQTVKAGWVQPLGTNWFFKPGIVVRDHVSDGFNYGPSRNPANHNP